MKGGVKSFKTQSLKAIAVSQFLVFSGCLGLIREPLGALFVDARG